jgi:hypothetical protein
VLALWAKLQGMLQGMLQAAGLVGCRNAKKTRYPKKNVAIFRRQLQVGNAL